MGLLIVTVTVTKRNSNNISSADVSDLWQEVNHSKLLSGDFFFSNELLVFESKSRFILDGSG